MPSQIQIRSFAKLDFGNPYSFLKKIRNFEQENDLSFAPEGIRTLRTNSLKSVREVRDAALFCVGMSEVLGHEVFFSPSEEQDYDFVARYFDGVTVTYCPVQLKELVSHQLNPSASIEDIIKKLSKYADLKKVTLAVRLNRKIRFDPAALSVPSDIEIGGLWIYGDVSQDQSEWCLWGDFCAGEVNTGVLYSYPS